jgi:hypothetical protein
LERNIKRHSTYDRDCPEIQASVTDHKILSHENSTRPSHFHHSENEGKQQLFTG